VPDNPLSRPAVFPDDQVGKALACMVDTTKDNDVAVMPVSAGEAELLLHCARLRIDATRRQRIAELAASRLDWDRVVVTARQHGLVPLLHRSLAGIAPAPAPLPVLERLRSLAEAFRFQSLVLAQELVSVLRALEDAGITAAPYKGPALAAYLFQDFALRQFSDLDLLVRPRDALRAKRVMMTLGYVPRRGGSGRWDAAWVRAHYEFSFTAPRNRYVLDLNWRIVERVWCFPAIPDSTWSKLGRHSVLGFDVAWPHSEDLLLVLCLHGCKHKWEALKWVVDVMELLQMHPDLDCSRALERARRAGAYRMVALGLLLASNLLQAPVPVPVLEEIRGIPGMDALAKEVRDDLFRTAARRDGDPRLFAFLARAADRVPMRLAFRALPLGYLLMRRLVRPCLAVLRRAFPG